jgi:hypothetical protein
MGLRFAPYVAGGYIPPGIGVPGAPTTPVATAGNATAMVVCSATTTGGSPITLFTSISSPGSVVATSATGTIQYPANSLTNSVAYTFTVTATNAQGTGAASLASNSVTPVASTNYVMYSNGVMDTTNWPDAQNVSFSCAQTYGYTTNPKPGHTQSLQLVYASPFGGGWQRSSNWGNIPPAGFDCSANTQVKFSILTPVSSGLYCSQHYTRSTGDDIATSTSATQGSTCYNTITLNTWSDVTIPLSSLGGLSSYNMHKCNLPGNNVALTCQIDDVIYIPGNTGWIFRGRLSGLESGWTDASTATANYAFLPQTLGASCYSINNPPAKASVFNGSVNAGTLTVNSLTSGAIAIGDALFYNSAVKGTISGGSGTVWTVTGSPGNQASIAMGSAPPASSIPAVKLTTSGANQVWKATTPSFSLTPYTNFTFGIIPTSGSSVFKVQFYNTSGTPVGSLITAGSTYTIHNFGTGTTWTVYNMVLTDFGAIGTPIGGVSIQETGTAGSSWYLSAIGFWS